MGCAVSVFVVVAAVAVALLPAGGPPRGNAHDPWPYG